VVRDQPRRGRERDGLGQVRVVLHKLDCRDPGGTQALGELVAGHDFGELGKKLQAGAQGDLALARQVEQATRRSLPQEPERTVLVSATIRIASTACASGGFDLSLHVR
jgi:hypothetical protein